jgi:branched-chain amino acid aminotransferase
MRSPIAYQNGRFVPADQVSIPLHDAGFVWGATVTDRVRTFNGRLFRPEQHLDRFRQSCERARVPLATASDRLLEISHRLVAENARSGDLSVIWLATPGPLTAFAASDISGPLEPTLIVYTRPIDLDRARTLARRGARLVTKAADLGVDPRVKHRSRLPWWISLQYVHDHDPDAEPLFMDLGPADVLETPTSNIMAVVGGTVYSPPPGEVLEGVSLAVVQELCDRIGLPFVREFVRRDVLFEGSEVLLSNTTDCIVGVSSIDHRPVPFPGPILNRLLDAWTELVGVDVRPPAES